MVQIRSRPPVYSDWTVLIFLLKDSVQLTSVRLSRIIFIIIKIPFLNCVTRNLFLWLKKKKIVVNLKTT